MDFNSIKKDIKTLSFEMLRTDSDDFFEAVIMKQELDKFNLRLKSLLGEPVYPAENTLADKIQKTVDSLGGVMSGQTLYYKDLGDSGIFAMLWPWRDGQRITLKIAHR